MTWQWGWLWWHSSTHGWTGTGAGYGVTAGPLGLAMGSQQDLWMTWHWGCLWGHSRTLGAGYRVTAAPMDGLAMGLAMVAQQHQQHPWIVWQWGYGGTAAMVAQQHPWAWRSRGWLWCRAGRACAGGRGQAVARRTEPSPAVAARLLAVAGSEQPAPIAQPRGGGRAGSCTVPPRRWGGDGCGAVPTVPAPLGISCAGKGGSGFPLAPFRVGVGCRRVNAVCVLGSGAGRCVTRGVGVDSF